MSKDSKKKSSDTSAEKSAVETETAEIQSESTETETETTPAGDSASNDVTETPAESDDAAAPTGDSGESIDKQSSDEGDAAVSDDSAPTSAPSEPTPTPSESKPVAKVTGNLAVEPPLVTELKQRLNTYLEAMGPGVPVSPEQGAMRQVGLLRTIQWLMNHDQQDFVTLWGTFLEIVSQHNQGRGAFSMKYAMRFLDAARITTDERRTFERLLNLAIRTADPASRMIALKQVDMVSTLAPIKREDIKQRFHGFYRL